MKETDDFVIGDIRRLLFVEESSPWNSYVRDKTAEMELEWIKYYQRKPSDI